MVDGVVGISGSGSLRPDAAEVFDSVDAAGIPVVAVDIPSGIDVHTGATDGPHVRAALTVTFGGLKPVHALGDCGRVELVDIGLDLPQSDVFEFEAADVAARWPFPGPKDDKYTQGVTGVLAGSATYPGAAVLCTGAAVAATSGMVRYAGSAAQHVISAWPEVVAAPSVAAAGRVQAWAVGPGLGTDETGAAALWFALETDLPVIVDADGLTILAAHPDLVANRAAPTVLTPHAGEFERLAGSPPGDDRVGATRKLADRLGVTVLLKGNITVIAEPGGPVYLNPRGQSWAATAGSGDVLSGIIGALLAAGLSPSQAAALAAYVHARAANLSASDPGPRPAPTSASRILAHVRAAIASLERKVLPCRASALTLPSISPAYTGRFAMAPVPALRMPDECMDAAAAYRFIHDELMLDGSSRLNLATFVTTWMDPEAEKLMAETFDKNMIDKDEYPATAAIEQRCVCMVADLFHAEDLRDDDPASATGVSTVGSSEAVMLAGLAMSWRWRAKVGDGKDGWRARKPNLVMGSNVQVVWEKFCRYFDVEPIYLPMEEGRYVITPEQVLSAVNEDTIGVVAILGTTYTGELEPIAEICTALDKMAADGGVDVPVHVDAASGGFVAPFLHPDVVWDFRLPRVVSINVSGHKYGLTYPGIGFVVWRSAEYLPEDLVFRVNYLGGDMPTFTLNFSKGGNQVIGQYYNFLRLGRSGYAQAMSSLSTTARWLGDQLRESQHFEIISDGSAIPVISFRLSGDPGYTEFDVSHALRSFGWQVPAYTMPDNASDVVVLRIVVREGFSADLARMLRDDLITVLAHLDALKPQGHFDELQPFAH